MVEPTREHLRALAKITAQFLIREGGMQNGYFTRAEGLVRIDTMDHMKVRVNSDDEVTLKSLRKMGEDLYARLHGYMVDQKIKGSIRVKSQHVEHGCFKTTVEYIVREEVDLWHEEDA